MKNTSIASLENLQAQTVCDFLDCLEEYTEAKLKYDRLKTRVIELMVENGIDSIDTMSLYQKNIRLMLNQHYTSLKTVELMQKYPQAYAECTEEKEKNPYIIVR